MRYEITIDKYRLRWNKNKNIHRLYGPAGELSGGKLWFKNGKYHRLDGPAVEYEDGRKYWYRDGILYAEEEFNREKYEI